MPQPSRYPMPLHGRTNRLGNYQSHTWTAALFVVAPAPNVHDDIGLHRTHAVLHRRVEIGRPPHAVTCGKHRQKTRRCDQALKARRPLRRRPDTIARPARVRIRSRNPCTRARRRLLGWKVRLPLATGFSSLSAARVSEPPGRSCFATLLLHSGDRGGLALVCYWPARSPGSNRSRVAAVSPTFGRLIEGTDAPSLGQTWPPPTNHPRVGSAHICCQPNP